MKARRRPIIQHVITRLDPGGSAENTVLSVELVDRNKFDSRVLTGPGLNGEGPPGKYRERLHDCLEIERTLVRPIRPLMDLRALYRLVHRFKSLRPDILHFHSAKAGALGRIAARIAGIDARIIYTPHGHVFSGYGINLTNRIFILIEKNLVAWSNAIVGLTTDEIRVFQAVGAGYPERFCVIPSGVELTGYFPDSPSGGSIREEKRDLLRKRLKVPATANIIGFVGRLDPVKGPDLFIKVAVEVHRRMPEAHFVIVGDGQMRQVLEHRARKAGLAEVVHWEGWRQDTSAYYHAFDLLALTSRNEGQGRVLVEAMAAELPIVAMISGGVPEVIADLETGILVKGGDVAGAADAVINLFHDPERRLLIGRAGRKRAEERFSVAVMIDRLQRLYTGLLEGETPAQIFGES